MVWSLTILTCEGRDWSFMVSEEPISSPFLTVRWRLTPQVVEEMVAQARASYPREACGILAGFADRLQNHYPGRNIAPGNEHFLLDPAEQRWIFADIARRGWTLLAIYHSHPRRDATPSLNDLRLAAYPQALTIIVSLADWDHPEIRGYQLRNGQAREVQVTLPIP
jgi:proteasome lid subunit RPN8/RPN11